MDIYQWTPLTSGNIASFSISSLYQYILFKLYSYKSDDYWRAILFFFPRCILHYNIFVRVFVTLRPRHFDIGMVIHLLTSGLCHIYTPFVSLEIQNKIRYSLARLNGVALRSQYFKMYVEIVKYACN